MNASIGHTRTRAEYLAPLVKQLDEAKAEADDVAKAQGYRSVAAQDARKLVQRLTARLRALA